ncbi:KTSC domain-containing protein [Gordonibacter sp.]|uniref:KTSC domain-containing protein n=1 Tax=Gordonibacter sp. TaxID=1968902 RepID=UPI003FA54122
MRFNLREGVIVMNMQPVSSSDLCSVGYDGGVLYVRFNSGGTYRYEGVSELVYRGLMSAPSHGKYFHANIKGIYPYERIG